MNLAQAMRKKNELLALVHKLEARVQQAMTYLEGHETYNQVDYEGMVLSLKDARSELFSLKVAIDTANHKDTGGVCVQHCIIRKGEIKAELEHTRGLRQVVDAVPYRWDEDAPEQKHRESAKELDIRIDRLEEELRKTDDLICALNGEIEVG